MGRCQVKTGGSVNDTTPGLGSKNVSYREAFFCQQSIVFRIPVHFVETKFGHEKLSSLANFGGFRSFVVYYSLPASKVYINIFKDKYAVDRYGSVLVEMSHKSHSAYNTE